ncbi:NIPSNAP family protein [Nonomuraea sp. LPB2021202275-12-8]|uniref:NIPSNAP family protein n=1 Tax=Nonomuraea sp. LPB2021202275-12-8 TaxID=3120159 RepID=UPI00300D4326
MIYELRRYTLRPGLRDTLIELFEREFVEAQEAAGMDVVGHFRDLDASDTFPWIRAFPDMDRRKAALTAFYTGPVWQANRDAANATMIDSDDVLLLRPAGHGFQRSRRPPAGSGAPPSSLYTATICSGVGPGFAEFFAEQVAPVLAEGGAAPVACFESEHAENTYPALPVRTGEQVFVWFARFERAEDEREVHVPALDEHLTAPPRRMRLAPAARSALR